MPRRRRLTDAGIARLRPEAREYTVWDTNMAGLGVRVRPSGSRTFVYHRKTDRGVKKLSFGPAALRKVEAVRRLCLEAETVEACEHDRTPAPLFQNFVAGPWKAACFDGYKPSTQKGCHSLLKRHLLPAFGSRRIDRITRSMVLGWFERCSRTTSTNANRALTLFGQILNHAVACGHIDANPARGIRPNPETRQTRFLSREEIARLHCVLDRYADGNRSEAQQADIVRLLLLTGCRKSEIVYLRRDEVRDDRLELADSKTGPRTVLLNEPARQVIARHMTEGDSPWVFSLRQRPVPSPMPRTVALGQDAARGRHWGCPPSRPQAHGSQPSGTERRAPAGRLLPARSQQCAHDSALRSRRRPRD